MKFRFWRRLKIFPGLRLNVNKRGVSVSGGIEGAQFTSGTNGSRTTIGIPGTGAFWTQKLGSKGAKTNGSNPEYTVSKKAIKGLDIVASLIIKGDQELAIKKAQKWLWIPDVAFLGGFTALHAKRYEQAKSMFIAGLQSASSGFISPYLGLNMLQGIELSSGGSIEIGFSEEGLFMGLAIAMEKSNELINARMVLEMAVDNEVSDGLGGTGLRLALADTILDAEENTDERAKKLLDLASWVEAESVSSGFLLLIRGRALRRLGLYFEAKATFSEIIKKKARMNDTILIGAHYERGIIHDRMGNKKQAQADYQWVYSRDDLYENVSEKITRSSK